MILENIKIMNQARANNIGMDVIIISTSCSYLENYWQKKLLNDKLLKPDALLITIYEDWKNGAGNGLGSLYAYKKAQEKAKEIYGFDINEMQKNGASIAIYHTAGQGKRLYPLAAAEFGNKSAVKLPAQSSSENGKDCMSILEAIIKQTSIFAPSRRSRLSVFWGDQIFIPAKNCEYQPSSHIDILVKSITVPKNNEEWIANKLDQYGIICPQEGTCPKAFDKIDFAFLQELQLNNVIKSHDEMQSSLGSFSLSYEITNAFLKEFEKELLQKDKKMDSDPFFWMPTTLDQGTYISLMQKKEYTENLALTHFERMQIFKDKFCEKFPELAYFGSINIGKHSYWWDFGNIQSYHSNILKMTKANYESEAMRMFFMECANHNVTSEYVLEYDSGSCLLNCNITSGRIKNSVLIDINAEHIDVENCIIIASNLKSVQAKDCVLYSVRENTNLTLDSGLVRADIYFPHSQEKIPLVSHLSHDIKENWFNKISSNQYSYAEIQNKISEYKELLK